MSDNNESTIFYIKAEYSKETHVIYEEKKRKTYIVLQKVIKVLNTNCNEIYINIL